MTMINDRSHERKSSGRDGVPKAPLRRRLLKALLPFLVLSAGLIGATVIVKSGPRAQKNEPVRKATLVEAVRLQPSLEPVVVKAMGTVIPAREIALKSGVSGEVVRLHPGFAVGSLVLAGSEALRIDDRDYKLAVIKARGQAEKALSEVRIEMGRQAVAKREWELLNDRNAASGSDAEQDSDLALRRPHLKNAEAALDAANAELAQAELNLTRTSVRAPFNAVVRSKNVDVGSHVSTQDTLATLAGTDEYWVQVSVPVDRLKWISFPDDRGKAGSKVTIRYGNSNPSASGLTGRVIKLLSDIEKEGRMARVMVSVMAPLAKQSRGENSLPLLLDSSVHVEIEGFKIDNALKIPRSALREGSSIWIIDGKGTLQIRPVEILWRDAQLVLVKNSVKEGERLILSDIPAPLEGMSLRLATPAEETAQGAAGTPRNDG